jgi:hypothetical protein
MRAMAIHFRNAFFHAPDKYSWRADENAFAMGQVKKYSVTVEILHEIVMEIRWTSSTFVGEIEFILYS